MRAARWRWRLGLLALALACSLGACAEDNNGSATGADYVEGGPNTDAEGAGESAPIAPGPEGPTNTAGEAESPTNVVIEPLDGDSSGGAAITLNGYATPTTGSSERGEPVIEGSPAATPASPTPTAGT